MESLYHIIYPIPEANRTRTRPLEILCLGLSRSGTDSLKQALEILGCHSVYHGFTIGENPGDAVVWCRLGFAKARQQQRQRQQQGSSPDHPDPVSFTASSFDRMIGDCDAVTDIPCAIFGPELLAAYPHAKVILNRRTDDEAWVRSIRSTLLPVASSWSYWFQCLFEAEGFWIRRCYDAIFTANFQARRWTADDQGLEFGKQFYREHYARLEDIMRRDGREWLDWGVQDGWAPLCAFLGRPEPPEGVEFPSGNDPTGYRERREQLHGRRHRLMRRNMWITAGFVGLGLAIVIPSVMMWYKLK